ncbi:unnamed protein product, partial [Sphagnum jensenii]
MEDDDDDKRSQHKILVAMKGHPGCAKSTVARAIARALRCPVIDKDDIRDCTLELEQLEIISSSAAARPSSSVLLCESCGAAAAAAAAAFSSSSSSSSTSSSVLNTLSYDVMWKVVETQLQVGLSVIVDCPLARPDLFKTACCLADRYGCRLMVVECRSGDENEWKLRLEARARAMAASLMANEDDDAEEELLMQGKKMHKPSHWADIEKLLAGYAGCWEYDTGTTSKLVVDTT